MAKDQFKMSKGELAKVWKKSHAEKDDFAKGNYDVFEDGRYRVAVTDADRGESKSSGRDQVFFEFTFLEGEYKGKTKREYFGLDRLESIPYLIRAIEAMGFEAPEEIADLEDVLAQIVKKRPILKIQLKTKGEYQNAYIQKVLDENETEDIEDVDGEDDAEQEQDKPKRVAKETQEEEEEEDEEEEEGEEEEEDGDEMEVEVGSKVKVNDTDGASLGNGTITAIDEDEEEVTVKLLNGKKVVVKLDQLEAPEKEAAPKAKLKARK